MVMLKSGHNKRTVLCLFAFLAISLFVTSAIASTPASATTTVNNISGEVNINSSLNVSLPSSTVSLSLNPLNTDFGSSNLNVSVSTNNPSGYTLVMSPVVANTTSLTRQNGTDTIPTLTDNTGGYTESDFPTNTWGYKLSSSNYLTFKNTNTIKTTNTASNVDTSTVSFAAKVDNTKPAGTYQIEIAFTATANPLPEPTTTGGKIAYNKNSNTAIGEMGDQSASDGNTVTLYAPNFKNPGYGFAGWNTKADGTGTNLGPNEDYTVPTGTTQNGLTLYAKWIESQGTLQNWTGCNSLAKGNVTALTDNRDGNTYAVAKLADNKCWMIENLRLDDTAELTAANTNNPALPLTNTDGTTSNHLSPSTDPTQTAWCSDANVACIDKSMLATNNTTLFTNNTASNYKTNSNVYSYGNYYNWYSVTANNGTYGISANNKSITGSICPAGWHLPVGGDKNNKTSSEFWSFNTSIIGTEPANASSQARPYYAGNPEGKNASEAIRVYPNNYIYSGYISGSSVSSRIGGGFYWSSTAYSNSLAYTMNFTSNKVYLGTDLSGKYTGRTVRCIASS